MPAQEEAEDAETECNAEVAEHAEFFLGRFSACSACSALKSSPRPLSDSARASRVARAWKSGETRRENSGPEAGTQRKRVAAYLTAPGERVMVSSLCPPISSERDLYHWTRNRNCVVREKPAWVVIAPRVAVPTRDAGPVNFGLLVAFSISMRNCALADPLSSMVFVKTRS